MFNEADRSSYIGGPDAAALLGQNIYRGPHDVIAEKKGLYFPRHDNWLKRCGRELEHLMVKDYGDRHNVRVQIQPGLHFHPRYQWAGGHPDAIVPSYSRLLEAKTTQFDDGYGEPGTDQVLPGVLIQCVWYMGILDLPDTVVLVLVRNRDLREYHITRDRELEDTVFEQVSEIHQRYIIGDELFPVDGSEGAHRYLAARFNKSNGTLVPSTPELDVLAMELRDLRGETKRAQEAESLIEAKFKAAIGDAEGIRGDWGTITWKNENGRVNYAGVCKDKRVEPHAQPLFETYRSRGGRIFRVPKSWSREEE